MRDLAVTMIMVIGLLAAVRRPYYGALLWVWVSVMNPHRLGWGFAYEQPFAQLAVVFTLLGMLLHSKDVRWPGGSPFYTLIVLVLWMGLTTFTAILIEPSLERYLFVLKIIFMTFIVAMVVRTREEIINLVLVLVMSIGYFGVKGGIFTLRGGGSERVWGPPGSVIEGNNELAVAIIMILPLLYFLAQEAHGAFPKAIASRIGVKWLKRGLYAVMALCAVSALGSQSRGALLATASMVLVLWWRSEKKLGLTIALVLAIPLVLAFMPKSWHSRMQTIETYEEDRSAMGRINAWTMAFNIATHRPTGAGFATAAPIIYAQYAPDPSFVLVAHSIYFQVLGEHGFIGLGFYLLMWGLTYAMAGRIVRSGKQRPDLKWAVSLANMIKVSLVGFAVGGAFLSLAYWDFPFYLMVVVVVLERLVGEKLAQRKMSMASQSAELQAVKLA